MHKVTKLKINSHGLRKSSPGKIKILSLMLFILILSLNAQGQGEIVKLGGSGSVNPLILETKDVSRAIIGGSFRGELEIEAWNKSAVGGEDVFISMWENSEILWLQTFGSNDNDAIVDRIWFDTDQSLCVFIVFWDEIEIGGELIVNTFGGKALVAVRLNYFDGGVLSAHLFSVQGSVNDVKLGFSGGECFLGSRINGSFYNTENDLIVEDFQGMLVGELRNDFSFRLIDTIGATGRQVLSGIATHENDILMVGFFNGILTLDGQVEQTSSVYDNAFAIKINAEEGGGEIKRFGGIFDNNFMRVEDQQGDWLVSGHFTGVLELGGGLTLESGNFNSNFVFLRLSEELEVLEAVQSFGGNMVRNFEMKLIDDKVFFGNQYFNDYEIGSIEVTCGTANLASDILSYSDGEFSAEENFCLTGNVNNPLYARGGGDIFSFTTNEDFSFHGEDYEVEGANDGFIYFSGTNSIAEYVEYENHLHIYPNPSSGQVNIEVAVNSEVRVYDFQGILVEIIAAKPGFSNIFNPEFPGIYFVGIVGMEMKKVFVGH